MSAARVLVFGLDSAPPSLVFDALAQRLPTITALRQRGVHGILRSTDPPITVPAWASMMTGCSPGTLGLYGFRKARSRNYFDDGIASSVDVTRPTVWQVASEAGKQVALLGVPQTFPVAPVQGRVVSDFLTPSLSSAFTHPPNLGAELLARFGRYVIDVEDFRNRPADHLRDQLIQMAENHFDIFGWLLEGPWDFAMMVEMATDRAQHVFWGRDDAFVARLYERIDRRIGQLLSNIDLDHTVVLITSDHGAQTMAGGFCVNEWLVRKGYLVLEHQPAGVVPLRGCGVNWRQTRAWAEGGYCARVFINVSGREPQGSVPRHAYEDLRDELASELQATTDQDGQPLCTKVLRPEDCYPQVNAVAPDLLVYFGDLQWRAIGTLGHPDIYVRDNDTGADGANHACEGIFIAAGGPVPYVATTASLDILDVAPTVLRLLGLDVRHSLDGHPMGVVTGP